jgi:hypothetical protein
MTRPDIARMKSPTYDADVNDVDALIVYIESLEADKDRDEIIIATLRDMAFENRDKYRAAVEALADLTTNE